MAHDLGEQEQHLLDEYEDTRRLLLTVLPPRLVDDDGAVAGSGEAAELATAIAIGFTIAAGQDVDEELDEQLGRINALIDEDAHEHGVERVRAAADRSLFVVGIGRDADGADEALAFAGDVRRHVDELAEDDAIDIGLHIGVSTGPIGVGVLRRGTMTFGAWGEPVRRALAIAALSATDDVLVDVGTYSSSITERFTLEPATDVVTLDDEPMGLHRLVVGTPDSTEPV
jgi:class 3 adenylate cyclase